jgi:hypothetical protein
MQEFDTLLVCRRRLLKSLLTAVSDPDVDRLLSGASAADPTTAATRLQNTVAALSKAFPSTAGVQPAAAAPVQGGRPAGRPASYWDRLSAATTLPRALTLSETRQLFEGLDARTLCAHCEHPPARGLLPEAILCQAALLRPSPAHLSVMPLCMPFSRPQTRLLQVWC